MSAETLRRAARQIRLEGTAHPALGPDFNNPRLLAVADLLDDFSHFEPPKTPHGYDRALAVARAYLGADQ